MRTNTYGDIRPPFNNTFDVTIYYIISCFLALLQFRARSCRIVCLYSVFAFFFFFVKHDECVDQWEFRCILDIRPRGNVQTLLVLGIVRQNACSGPLAVRNLDLNNYRTLGKCRREGLAITSGLQPGSWLRDVKPCRQSQG